METLLLKRLLTIKIKELGFKDLGCYHADLEKLSREDLNRVLENIEFASTDIQVTIDNKQYIVEIMTSDNEVDFDVLQKGIYIKRYGLTEDTYNEKFNII